MKTPLEKIKHYCAYSERCHSDVRNKLLELEVYGAELETTISILIEENYLNEERYACAVARGKFNLKKWGRNKIIHYLKSKNISSYLIKKSLEEIDEEYYWKTLQILAEKKKETLAGEKSKWAMQTKLMNYLIQKGYESDLVYNIVKKYF